MPSRMRPLLAAIRRSLTSSTIKSGMEENLASTPITQLRPALPKTRAASPVATGTLSKATNVFARPLTRSAEDSVDRRTVTALARPRRSVTQMSGRGAYFVKRVTPLVAPFGAPSSPGMLMSASMLGMTSRAAVVVRSHFTVVLLEEQTALLFPASRTCLAWADLVSSTSACPGTSLPSTTPCAWTRRRSRSSRTLLSLGGIGLLP